MYVCCKYATCVYISNMINIELHHKQNSLWDFTYEDTEFLDVYFEGIYCDRWNEIETFSCSGEEIPYVEENLKTMNELIAAQLEVERGAMKEVINNILIKNEDR